MQCATREQLRDAVTFRDQVLTNDIAKAGFASDMQALREADAVVLLLPCGRSAHLELGWACGAGKPTAVVLEPRIDEPELMYLMTSTIVLGATELLHWLIGLEKTR